MINVILADHQRIFRIGMATALAAEDDIRIVGQPYSIDQLLSGLTKFRVHVLVLSSAFMGQLEEIKELSARNQTAIVFLEETANTYAPQSLSGVDCVMQRSVDEATVVRCICHLARGGKVLRYVRNQAVEFRQDSVGLRVRRRLSALDVRIIALVVKGYKNREIASQVGGTEHGIKNSLRRIFDKTGVSDRLELALFVLHHGMISRSYGDTRAVPMPNSIAVRYPFQDTSYSRITN